MLASSGVVGLHKFTKNSGMRTGSASVSLDLAEVHPLTCKASGLPEPENVRLSTSRHPLIHPECQMVPPAAVPEKAGLNAIARFPPLAFDRVRGPLPGTSCRFR